MKNLKAQNIWMCFRNEEGKGKVPYNPKTGGRTAPNNPDTWASHELALQKSPEYDGIGFAIPAGYGVIDLDDVIGNPEREKQADDIMKQINSYTELSPSGKGYHIIFRCDTEQLKSCMEESPYNYYINNRKQGCEIYISGLTTKYITYTGKTINESDTKDIPTPQLMAFYDQYMRKGEKTIAKSAESVKASETPAISDEDALRIAADAKDGKQFIKLFYLGDISAYDNDHSKADFALCRKLAFATQGNKAQIDRLFRRSRLYRNKWEREDYREDTIINAISSCESFYQPKETKSFTVKTNEGKKVLQIADVEQNLKDKRIEIKYNEITHNCDIVTDDKEIVKKYGDHLSKVLVAILLDELRLKYKGVTERVIEEFIKEISTRNRYNPVLNFLNELEWDKKERFPEVYQILGIEEDKLSQLLLYKWFYQCACMAQNTLQKPFGAESCCVLVGPQGIGKTSFFRSIAVKNEFFHEGCFINVLDKDTVIRSCECWIAELGEVECTFKKSDIAYLKALITNKSDIYRKPYGRSDLEYARRCSFCATANNTAYLVDTTGNRRFWTIPVEKIDLEKLKQLDVCQLWAEVYEKAKKDLNGFRLTPEERKLLDERNGEHEKLLPAEDEIRDILAKTETLYPKYHFIDATISEFQAQHDSLKSFSGRVLASALNKLGIEAERKTVNGRQGRYRKLPMPINYASSKPTEAEERAYAGNMDYNQVIAVDNTEMDADNFPGLGLTKSEIDAINI